MQSEVLDSFEEVSGWNAIASGQARLDISQDQGLRGKALLAFNPINQFHYEQKRSRSNAY